MGEWVLSAGGGFSRRRNSSVPIGPYLSDAEHQVERVAAWYRERGVVPRFRITPECAPETDELLMQLGYIREAPTVVLARSLDASVIPDGIVESPVATDAWITAELDALGIDRSLVGPWVETINAVPSPRVFAMAINEGAAIGAGFGVVVDGLLASFEVAVAEAHRRQGHARRLMAALHAFGAREGAGEAFLQVEEANAPAIALYESLGYRLAYPYWYRLLDA